MCNMISQEASNLVTQTVWNTSDDEWTPRDFFDRSPTERATQDDFHNVDIKHFFCDDGAPEDGDETDNGEEGQTKIDTEGGENTSTGTEPGDTEVNNETLNGQGDGDGEGEGEEGVEQGDNSETETEV